MNESARVRVNREGDLDGRDYKMFDWWGIRI